MYVSPSSTRIPLVTFDLLAFMNIIETLLNLAYLYLAHVSAWPPAIIVGLSAAVMTVSKTWLYWLQEYYCGFCSIGHNSGKDLLVYWIIPNGCVSVIYQYINFKLNRISKALDRHPYSDCNSAWERSLFSFIYRPKGFEDCEEQVIWKGYFEDLCDAELDYLAVMYVHGLLPFIDELSNTLDLEHICTS